MTQFNWNKVQYREDGKVLLLYRHERIFSEGLIRPGMFCCDVGGWGHLTERIRQEGCETIILDKFTEEQYYSERVKNETYIEGDICDSIFTEQYVNSFDLVTCFEVLEHVGSNLEQMFAFENMYKMLKPNGNLRGTFPIPNKVHMKNDPTVTSWMDQNTIVRFMQGVGFININIEETGSITKDEEPSSWYFKGAKRTSEINGIVV